MLINSRWKQQVLRFNDIANAIANENRDISAGNIKIGNMQPTIQVKGQFNTAYDMQNIVIKNIYRCNRFT